MPWNSTFPSGSVSVKANETIGQQNTTYIETTMGNSIVGTNTVATRDHFWNVGSNEDGRHRFIQSPKFTVGGSAADPVIGTGMDGVLYFKTVSTDISRIEGFYRNSNGIYQVFPSFVQGTRVVNSSGSYTTVVALPANCYGEIFMYTTALGRFSAVRGFFRSNATTLEAWAYKNLAEGSSGSVAALKFADGSDASGLNLRARLEEGAAATYNYRITYRAL